MSFVPWLDWGAIVLLVFALLVFVFGGFREHVGALRLSVRSADRLVVLAILLTVVRHLLVPAPSIAMTIQKAWARLTSSDALAAAFPAFAATRLGVLLTGYLAVVTIGIIPGTERFRISSDELENLLARWDASWYLSIVTHGYQWNGDVQQQQNVVFFPAFPLAMRLTGTVLGDHWLAAGLLLALAAFLLALTYLFRLSRQLMSEERARHAVWLVAAYPFAVYYSAPYTESFYLLGSVATFFHLSRSEWGRAAAWGVFVALCRPNGFLIGLPALLFAFHASRGKKDIPLGALLAAAAPALGIAAYSAYLYLRFGDPLVWMKGQAAWGRVYAGMGAGLYALFFDRYELIAHRGWSFYVSSNPYDFMYSAAALFMLASLWPCARRFGLPYAAFIAINIVPPLVMGGLMSIGRMTAVLFPAFLWLATVGSPRQVSAVVVAFAMLQGLIAVLFFTWRPVF